MPARPLAPGSLAPGSLAPADAETVPSWTAVLGTTVRLWAQRRLPGRWQRRPGEGAARRRAIAAVIGTAIVVVAVVVVLLLTGVVTAPGSGRATDRSGAGAAAQIAAVSASWKEAAIWVAAQVSHAAIVSCDPVMCSALQARGFPVGNLTMLGPSSTDPLGSAVVVATAAIRSQFGSRLARVYAPEVIASFGSGAARIDVRAVALYGAAAYQRELHADMVARQRSGGQLVQNRRLQISPAARRELSAGQVDSRLMIILAELADVRGVDVLSFGDGGPGASTGVPLRSAELAVIGRSASGRGYLKWLLAFLRGQRPPYQAASLSQGRAFGHQVVTIEFSAPSPLGLLGKTGP